MLSTVITAEMQFRFESAERSREQRLLESIRNREAVSRRRERPSRRPQPPRPVVATACCA